MKYRRWKSTKPNRTRTASSGYAFISYSTKDWPFVSKLVDALKNGGVWVDKRSVELGEALPDKIETGISGAASFVLVLSKSSLASSWVKYESNMATIRHLEDSNFRILVVKIDDCVVPLRFRPFLYADLTKDPAAMSGIVKAASSRDGGGMLYRRHFVNRSDELGQIELHVSDPDIPLICLHGFYGIGKRSLAEESIRKIWQSPTITPIELSPAHEGARLAASLCAAAGLVIPPDGASAAEMRQASFLAVETLVEKGHILVFDHLEQLLDSDGKPHADILSVIDHIAGLSSSTKVPCYLLSRRMPKLPVATTLKTGFVRVGGLETTHVATILESEASRISRRPFKSNAALRSLADHLFGYPLAGRLAAPLIVKYSPEYLQEHLIHITSLRRDIAEAILANTGFSEAQTRLLQILAVCDGSLAVGDLAAIAEVTADAVVNDVDTLADHNLLESDGTAVRLHPLVADFYWKQARGARDFRSLVSRIADHATKIVGQEKPNTVRFVNWLATACRALFLSDRGAEATKLRRDFIGELKLAAIELYQRGEYGISLRYCDEFLAQDPNDFEVNFHRARNLSRTGKRDESLGVIDRLLGSTKNRFQLARLHFARGRVFWEIRNGDAAKTEFLKAIEMNPSSLPALQGVSEVLLTQGRIDDASGFIEQALKISPMDSFALSMKA